MFGDIVTTVASRETAVGMLAVVAIAVVEVEVTNVAVQTEFVTVATMVVNEVAMVFVAVVAVVTVIVVAMAVSVIMVDPVEAAATGASGKMNFDDRFTTTTGDLANTGVSADSFADAVVRNGSTIGRCTAVAIRFNGVQYLDLLST